MKDRKPEDLRGAEILKDHWVKIIRSPHGLTCVPPDTLPAQT
jgi:hypothetical protein